jgi:hypothetical protein
MGIDQRVLEGFVAWIGEAGQPSRWPVSILHGCLRHHTPYNEHTAWAHRNTVAA